MPLKIIRNNLSKMTTDVIANPANEGLKMGDGVCGAIFSAAGEKALQRACDVIGHCDVGEVVITESYDLLSKAIIHVVGPLWQDGTKNEKSLLEGCYKKSLDLTLKEGYGSIALPLISTGALGYPKEEALTVAVGSIRKFLETNELMVYLVVDDREAYAISPDRYKHIERFIDDHYVGDHLIIREYSTSESISNSDSYTDAILTSSPKKKRSLEDVVNNLEETFSEQLIRLIDEKGMMDVEVYKRANIDRKLFSKIRSKPAYRPSKTTAIALAIAIQLNFDETQDLLEKLGYTLSRSSRFDVIIEFFIKEGNYDIFEINEALFAFDESVLG